jgi:hypothetical protein
MATISEIKSVETEQLLLRFEHYGGVVDFCIFRVVGIRSTSEGHLEVARTAIRSDLLSLVDSHQVSTFSFFGPYFDFNSKRPILRGRRGRSIGNVIVYDQEFYFDEEETVENALTVRSIGDYVTQGYTDAFLRPPYPFGGSLTNFEIGSFFLEFNSTILGDLDTMLIYEWSTEFSDYFEDGKEWWGSFFWTVYNAEKDWFVSILASTTD